MNLDEKGSLKHVSVVVTRSREQNATLRGLLEQRGADVVDCPTLRFVATPTAALEELPSAEERYTHLIFTSRTAVEFFAEACKTAGLSLETWRDADVAAVGSTTARVLAEHGWQPSVVTDAGGEKLAAELLASGRVNPGSHVLLPQSAIARPELARQLREAGARVRTLSVYDTATEVPECAESFLVRVRGDAPPDAILFASPSAVTAFLELTRDLGQAFLAREETRIISIGPTTSTAIRERGYRVAAQAERPGIEGLVDALEEAVD